MIEPIAWPPSAAAPSIITTLRPSLAASSAADTPEIPAPSTHRSAVMVVGTRSPARRMVRVGINADVILPAPRLLARSLFLDQDSASRHGLHAVLIDREIALGFGQYRR